MALLLGGGHGGVIVLVVLVNWGLEGGTGVMEDSRGG